MKRTSKPVGHLKRIWNYRDDDKTTWKYIDYAMVMLNGKMSIRWILNQNFAFKKEDMEYQNATSQR